MSEGMLQALRDRINARLQTSAISRDRASAAGREVVAQCRQSDVETLEWVLSEIDAVLATPEPGIALLRTPRGEGEAEALAWRVEFRPLGEIEWQRFGTYDYPDIAEDRALILSSSGRMEWRIVPLYPAALRSEAQGEDDLASLIVRMWTRCRHDGPHYRESDEFWEDFERAYRLAAARQEGGSDG